MNNNLLIVGASTYGVLASEIAADMGCFEKIDFIDDERKITSNGIKVIGTIRDIHDLEVQYSNIVVAIGNSEVRVSLLKKIKEETSYRIVTLISPKAYISPSARIMSGCIVEPMSVVHTGCIICSGCIISAGAVVNHASMCCYGVHLDCNSTVEGYCFVPTGTKIFSGEIYQKKYMQSSKDLLFDPQKWAENLNNIDELTYRQIEELKYEFENIM